MKRRTGPMPVGWGTSLIVSDWFHLRLLYTGKVLLRQHHGDKVRTGGYFSARWSEWSSQVTRNMHLLQDHQGYVSTMWRLDTRDNALAGEIPSFKLVETDKVFSFLDIGPLSKGHALIIPKCMVTFPRSLITLARTNVMT